LAFLINASIHGVALSTILLTASIGCLLLLSLYSAAWARRLVYFSSPWGLATLLLLIGWAGGNGLGNRGRFLAAAASAIPAMVFLGACLAAAAVIRTRRRLNLFVQAAAVAVGALVALECAVWLTPSTSAKIGPYAAGAGPAKPNIVLITLDTVRADHLSLYGYSRRNTPHLEKLAQEATVFTRAVAAGNVTLTSHSAIFTGLYASWTGVGSGKPSHGAPMLSKYATAPVILSQNGYFTGAVVANTSNLQPAFGFDRGFQFFDYRMPPQLLPWNRTYLLRNSARRVLDLFTCTAEFDLGSRRASEINDDAFRFLDQARGSGRPFFLFLNYMDAHTTYAPPPPYDNLFPGKDCSVNTARYIQLMQDLVAGKATLPDRERRHFISQYDGAIAFIDAEVQRLIAELEQRGLYDNTLIVITSDHGESLGDRNLLYHGLSAYQNQVHVPLLVKYPGPGERKVVKTPVSHTDILPTLLEAAGIAPPANLQGRSLRRPEAPRTVISEAFPRPGFAKFPGFDTVRRAIYDQNFKFIESAAGKRELYDIERDQLELHDLCAEQSGRCEAMHRSLTAWTGAIPAQTVRPARIDPETVQRLKSLGYVGQ
jgi:arylsulfatase A-like enzyme